MKNKNFKEYCNFLVKSGELDVPGKMKLVENAVAEIWYELKKSFPITKMKLLKWTNNSNSPKKHPTMNTYNCTNEKNENWNKKFMNGNC